MTLLYLSRHDVEGLQLPMSRVIELVETGFRLKGQAETQMPPKIAIHPRGSNTFLHAMPAYVGGQVDAASVKWVGGADDNHKRGLPTISGLLILNDPETMFPLAVMDCIWITAMRTGAANAVAMKYLGPKQADELAVLGTGTQGRSNLLAMATRYPGARRCRAWDPDREALEAYVEQMSAEVDLEIVPVQDPEQAVRGADVIVTAGPSPRDPQPYIHFEWLKPGAMAAPVDYNGAWMEDALRGVDKLAVDDHAQMDYYRAKHYFKNTPRPYADMGEIVAGLKQGRERDDEITMSMCMGIAVDDCVTADLVYRTALERGVGTQLPL